MRNTLLLLAAVSSWLSAAHLGGAGPEGLRRWSADLVRPLVLPFLWRSLRDAEIAGDPAEAFARGRQLLAALPGWTDGHTVFAFRYVLDGGDAAAAPPARAAATRHRLELALTFLDEARAHAGRREDDLLVAAAFLVELAARNEPGLADCMAEDPALVADRLLAAAESVRGRDSVREQRVYLAPRVAAALWRAGDRPRALAVLDDAANRCDLLRDHAAAAEWQDTLLRVRRALAGDASVPTAPLCDDPRLRELHPFLKS